MTPENAKVVFGGLPREAVLTVTVISIGSTGKMATVRLPTGTMHWVSTENLEVPVEDQTMVVDHTCGDRTCNDPSHLEIVPLAEVVNR